MTTPADIITDELIVTQPDPLGMSESWVRAAIRDHGLPARRVGATGHTLIPLAALRSWLTGTTGRRHLEVAS